MVDSIKVGDFVLYITQTRIEVGRVARIDVGSDRYKIVPVEKGHFAKKRNKSELLPLDKINEMVKDYLVQH